MINAKYKATFIENECYHIYNRTNNNEILYRDEGDFTFFMKRYSEMTAGYLDLYSWNLLPTHFHLLAKVRSYSAICHHIKHIPADSLVMTEKKFLRQKATIHELIDNLFQRFLISYCMKFNSKHERKGNLLHRPFKHKLIDKESQFTQAIIYINANAVKHGIVKNINDYKWSSYHDIISDEKTNVCRQYILDWFGGREQFIKVLHEQTAYYNNSDVGIEEE